MKLIFIYGPPAVGKLTVTRELVKITRFSNFHNHYAYDFVNALIDHTNPNFSKYVEKIMLDGIEIAAKERVRGIVFTFCYEHKQDDIFIKKVIEIVKKNNGLVDFVQLTCQNQELFKRVKEKSRKSYKKVKTVKALKNILKKWTLDQEIPFVRSLKIDNSRIEPKKVALMIKQKYNL